VAKGRRGAEGGEGGERTRGSGIVNSKKKGRVTKPAAELLSRTASICSEVGRGWQAMAARITLPRSKHADSGAEHSRAVPCPHPFPTHIFSRRPPGGSTMVPFSSDGMLYTFRR
jgi:hypothetical protein